MTDSNPEPEQVVRDCFAWFNGDGSKIDSMSESIDVYNPGLPDEEVHGRDAWEAYLKELKKGFPDISFEIEEVATNGTIVMVEATVSGTHTGEFQGLPATGREVEVQTMVKAVVENGRIEEWHEYYNRQEVPEQLGLTFPTIIGQLPKLLWRKLRV